MNCFHCGNRLGKGDICLTCGQDVRLFKKIVAASWRYYDDGLKKARMRNLSGAIEDLKNSLLLYKKNTEARNLLGLIYYEMGETAEALVQWVLSDNMDETGRHAADLLAKVQSDQIELQKGNLTIRKYNQALRYARGDSGDLALLQLNKVLSTNPKMVKANLLMALLQLKAREPDKAANSVQEVLKVDRGNMTALRLSEELGTREVRRTAAREKITVSKDAQVRRQLSGDDVIVPTYKENKIGLQTIVEVLIGLALGAALVAYLIMPSRINSLRADFNQTINSYNERLAAKEAIITANESEIEALNEQIAKLEENVQSADANTSNVVKEYGKLLEASQLLAEDEYLQGIRMFLTVDASQVPDRTLQGVYQFKANGYTVLLDAGRRQYDSRQYAAATEYFLTCLELVPEEETIEAQFWMGLAYVNLGEQETANTYFEKIIELAPESNFAQQAAGYIR